MAAMRMREPIASRLTGSGEAMTSLTMPPTSVSGTQGAGTWLPMTSTARHGAKREYGELVDKDAAVAAAQAGASLGDDPAAHVDGPRGLHGPVVG